MEQRLQNWEWYLKATSGLMVSSLGGRGSLPYWKFRGSYISFMERAEGLGGAVETSGERAKALSMLQDILARREGVKEAVEDKEDMSCTRAGISAKGTRLEERGVEGGGDEGEVRGSGSKSVSWKIS